MTTKRLGFVFIVTAHIVFNVPSGAEVTGFLGTNITLEFTFNSRVDLSQGPGLFMIHKNKDSKRKIAEFPQGKEWGDFSVNPGKKSIYWYIPKLKVNDSGPYIASLVTGQGPAEKSKWVMLKVQEPNTSTTVPPEPEQSAETEGKPSVGSSNVMALLLIAPVVVFLVALPLLIWFLVSQKDDPDGQNSTPKETVQESVKASESSLVYSVLDFPMRSSAVLEVNPSDTEYAAVSYLPEMRPV